MAIDAGTINSQVRVALDKLKGDVASVQTQMNKIGSMADQTAGQTEKSFTEGFAGMQIAGVAAFAAITMAMKTAIAVAGEYEQSIANVQSVVMGASDVFTQLDNAAKLAGQSTRFTASQAADALYDLASGGLSAAESVGALDGVLLLAGASQANLSSTAAVLVATLNQYNLKAEESVRISNVFSAAIANSMANMEKLTAGMRQAGPVSSALGISLEETVASLAALYDAGFQGEQAGTALRAIMSSLAAETDATTQKLLAQGIAYEDINPAMNSFADVIGTIADAGLTAGDVMNAFGNRAGAQMLTLLNNGKKGLNQYRDAITGTNTAAEMYAIQNDTLRGSIDRLKSAAESAMIEFSEEFTPAMRGALEVVTYIILF
ncbi:MAG: phage tail tape measure protein [Prevotella sp.]|nr:phage tail tape measure protein [Prevotella sp.]